MLHRGWKSGVLRVEQMRRLVLIISLLDMDLMLGTLGLWSQASAQGSLCTEVYAGVHEGYQ